MAILYKKIINQCLKYIQGNYIQMSLLHYLVLNCHIASYLMNPAVQAIIIKLHGVSCGSHMGLAVGYTSLACENFGQTFNLKKKISFNIYMLISFGSMIVMEAIYHHVMFQFPISKVHRTCMCFYDIGIFGYMVTLPVYIFSVIVIINADLLSLTFRLM